MNVVIVDSAECQNLLLLYDASGRRFIYDLLGSGPAV